MSNDHGPMTKMNDLTIVADATCTRCGCTCDDIALHVYENRIVEARRACQLGKQWFFSHRGQRHPACFIEGREASVEEGIERAADILTQALYPLVYGLSDTSTETQRVAVSIGDWIGGAVDTSTSTAQGPTGVAFHGVGEVTSTLGEIRNRGDLLIFWGCNPVASHPRHLTRYSLTPQGMFVPGGRKDRTCVAVDVRHTATADVADTFLQIRPGGDFEALWTLRALAKGVELDGAAVEADTGVPLAAWQNLMDLMKQAKFGVLLYGAGLMMTGGKHLNTESLLALTRDMNAFTRFVARPMRGRGNVTGADNVMTWQTGYPLGVNFSRGYPRFNPGEYTANELLERKEADAAMLVAADPERELSHAALKHLASIPRIVLGATGASTLATGADVVFHTATYGIHSAGTVYRMDEVPIPLRPALCSPLPADFDLLSALERRVRELKVARS